MFRIACAMTIVGVMTGTAWAQDGAAIARGQTVYTAQKCAVCHSIAGKGNSKGPLDTVGTRLSADDIRHWIVDAPAMTAKARATRKPAMKSYANLPKDDVEALVAYLQSLKQ